MPKNPYRATQGGDVDGQTKIDTRWSVGESIDVAKACFDPGYSLDTTLSDSGIKVSKADLVVGYCSYGKATGEPGAS